MGQLVDLHAVMQSLLGEIKDAAAALDPAVALHVKAEPPLQLPGMPCVFVLTPDEQFDYVDINTGRSLITFVIRLCVDARKPQTALLALADVVVEVTDLWLRNDHPAPIDQARRTGMRGVTPVFGDIPTRGADFPISLELEFRPITPAP